MSETTNNLSSNLIVSGIKPSVVPAKNESLSVTVPADTSTSDDSLKVFEPPDGTWRGWVIMLSAFLCNGVIFGIINTYSVIYLRLQNQLEASGDKEASSKAGENFLIKSIKLCKWFRGAREREKVREIF